MWQIGPDPLISTDMHEYYRSLATADDAPDSATASAFTASSAGAPTEPIGLDPLWQLVRYMAWTLLGPSTAVTTLCVLLLDGAQWLDWKMAVLIASTLLSAAPYVHFFAAKPPPPAPQEDDSLEIAEWKTSWR